MTHTLEDWVDALKMKRHGNEYKSPCPLCGGNDQFWAKRGDTHEVVLGCRGCLMGIEGKARAKRIEEITRAVFGDAAPRLSAPATASIPRSRESRSRTPTRSTAPTASSSTGSCSRNATGRT